MADMRKLRELQVETLTDAEIKGHELQLFRDAIYADGAVDQQEAELLVETYKKLRKVNPSFESFLFRALKDYVLRDGSIRAEEANWLKRTLFSDDSKADSKKKFLSELRGEARQVAPEFEALYAECAKSE